MLKQIKKKIKPSVRPSNFCLKRVEKNGNLKEPNNQIHIETSWRKKKSLMCRYAVAEIGGSPRNYFGNENSS